MPIVVRLDVMLALRKRKAKELSAAIGISEQNISLLRQGKVKGIRFETLDKICEFLDCEPGDILDREPAAEPAERQGGAGNAAKLMTMLALAFPLAMLVIDAFSGSGALS
jgi:Predicted transcriptional regulator